MHIPVVLIIMLYVVFGFTFLFSIIWLWRFLISYSKHNRRFVFNDYEDEYNWGCYNVIKEDCKNISFKSKDIKNIYMRYKIFKPLYKGNQNDWVTLIHDTKYAETNIYGYIPCYIDNNIVYMVHFSSVFGYLVYYIMYTDKVLKGRSAYNSINIMKITEDVQHECEKRLDEIYKKHESARDELSTILNRMQSSNNK